MVVVIVAGRHLAPALQVGLGFFEIVVVAAVVAGAQFLARLPGVDAFGGLLAPGHAGLLVRVIAHCFAAGQGAVRIGDVVREHQHVLRGFMPHVVVDALVLAQARDEIEVALAVLHAVGPIAVAARELQFEGVAVTLQHFSHDLGNAAVLEDPVVVPLRGQPEPRAQPHGVEGVPRVLARKAEARDDAGQMPRAAVAGLHRHGGGLAEQGLGVDGVAVAEQLDVEGIRLAQRLAPDQPMELQRLAHGRGNADAAASVDGPGQQEFLLNIRLLESK